MAGKVAAAQPELADLKADIDAFKVDGTSPDGLVPRDGSVYSMRSTRKRYGLLLLMACAYMMLPLCDTIYLPALVSIQKDLNTDATATAGSVAIYLFLVGVGALLWGPVIDRFGRRPTLWAASAAFVGFSVACYFATNITQLIVFRALQGMAVASYGVGAQAIMADTFPPQERGKAMGLLSIPLLVGPILGPVIGGALSFRFGWRATFAAMAVLGGLLFGLLLAFLEETHHYHTLRRVQQSHPDLASFTFREPIDKPTLEAPWMPLVHLLDPEIWPAVLATITCFGVMFSSLIVLPARLAAAPYRLNEAQIGAANVPGGLGSFLSSPAGGLLADWASRRWAAHSNGRLLIDAPVALVLFPAGCLMYAWSLSLHHHLAVVLTATFLLGAGLAFIMPATFSLVSITKQRAAAAASGGVSTLMFLSAGLFVLV